MEPHAYSIVRNQFKKAPRAIQDLLLSPKLTESLKTITAKHTQDKEKRDAVENEVMMVLLGLESLNDLEANLTEEGSFTQEQAIHIAQDITLSIILPVENELRVFLQKELATSEENIPLSAENNAEESPEKEMGRQAEGVEIEKIKNLLRENRKTVSVKNIVANLK
ncbi:hypothetical protein HYW58_01135 [Candidatus Kaiserbacteria bacterium]|nr:hypothetical protein [Candidatus Kaiserbacteria bacterium]